MTREEELSNVKHQLENYKKMLDSRFKELSEVSSLEDVKASTFIRMREDADTISNLSYLATYIMLNK